MTHSIEFLKKARETGATHYKEHDDTVVFYEKFFSEYFVVDGSGDCERAVLSDDEINSLIKIDYSLLNDYYADKQLDINVTGVSE